MIEWERRQSYGNHVKRNQLFTEGTVDGETICVGWGFRGGVWWGWKRVSNCIKQGVTNGKFPDLPGSRVTRKVSLASPG